MSRRILAVLLAFVVVAACQNDPLPTSPGTTVIVNQTVIIEGGEAPGTNKPPSGSCVVTRLAGGIFGDRGGAACSGRVSGRLKVGCEVDFTITPKKLDGTDAEPILHGTDLTVSETVGADRVTKGEDSSNVFNLVLTGSTPGPYQLTATLVPPGCAAITRTYDLEVQP